MTIATCWRIGCAGLVVVALAGSLAAAPPKRGGVAPATTVQLPTFGISIDAQGVLTVRVAADPTGQLHRQRLAAAEANLAPELMRPGELRKVSLARLERALARRIAEGKGPDEAMQHLAGLQQVRYVFCFPESGDVVVAGPAEGWIADPAGRAVGVASGQPVLKLVDLAVALRAYPPGGRGQPMVGCTIDPTEEGLSKLRAFQETIPRTVSERQRPHVQQYVGQGIADSLGQARVRTFGVPPTSHFAHVMIEADYRMKRIGIGLEPPPIKLSSYLDLVRSPRMGMLQRWWFTPDYDALRVSADRLALELVGQGVQLQTEDKVIGLAGKLEASPLHDQASEQFAAGFTAKYPQLAAASPVFAQLRGLVDMLIVAAWMQRADYYGQAGWSPAALADEGQLPVATLQAIERAPAAVNCIWRGSRLLAPAGGGVSIHAHLALEPERIKPDEDGTLRQRRAALQRAPHAETWWWD